MVIAESARQRQAQSSTEITHPLCPGGQFSSVAIAYSQSILDTPEASRPKSPGSFGPTSQVTFVSGAQPFKPTSVVRFIQLTITDMHASSRLLRDDDGLRGSSSPSGRCLGHAPAALEYKRLNNRGDVEETE